jgi:hypothetical protein
MRSDEGYGDGMATDTTQKVVTSLASGLVGAVAVTAVHETTRRVTQPAPRMDILGERGIARLFAATGHAPPVRKTLHRMALGGDIVSNSLYFALVGTGRRAWARGFGLGLLAGVGAVVLPPYLGLGKAPRGLTPRVKLMTVAYYTLGGLAAAAASRLMSGIEQHER